MSSSISKSLNMRTLSEALSDQQNYEQHITISVDDEPDYSSTALVAEPAMDQSALDKAYADIKDLDNAVDEHYDEASSTIETAKETFDTIFAIAQSVPPEKSARLFEVAAQYLDIVNKSSESRVSAKHDRAKLSVALTKAQISAGLVDDQKAGGLKAHRNDILRALMGDNVSDADFTDDSDAKENK